MRQVNQQRVEEFLRYHSDSSHALDIDPANDCLRYICDRYELNPEQRSWLAFLYATCYSPTTAFFMYNEFPDYETIDDGRLQRWWDANREKVIFQTDRRWTRSRNQWVDCVRSYREHIQNAGWIQGLAFAKVGDETATQLHNRMWDYFKNVFTFGRFTMFLYLEMVNTLTSHDLAPTTLNMREAESCRNGVAYALGFDSLLTKDDKRRDNGQRLSKPEMNGLQQSFDYLRDRVYDDANGGLEQHDNVWSIETTLCAYRKFKEGKRWVGYYIERARRELVQMEQNVQDGVEWDVLWQFRRETYDPTYLKELS